MPCWRLEGGCRGTVSRVRPSAQKEMLLLPWDPQARRHDLFDRSHYSTCIRVTGGTARASEKTTMEDRPFMRHTALHRRSRYGLSRRCSLRWRRNSISSCPDVSHRHPQPALKPWTFPGSLCACSRTGRRRRSLLVAPAVDMGASMVDIQGNPTSARSSHVTAFFVIPRESAESRHVSCRVVPTFATRDARCKPFTSPTPDRA